MMFLGSEQKKKIKKPGIQGGSFPAEWSGPYAASRLVDHKVQMDRKSFNDWSSNVFYL